MFSLQQIYDICLAQYAAKCFSRKMMDVSPSCVPLVYNYDWQIYLKPKLYENEMKDIDISSFNDDIRLTTDSLYKEFKYTYEVEGQYTETHKNLIKEKLLEKLNKYIID